MLTAHHCDLALAGHRLVSELASPLLILVLACLQGTSGWQDLQMSV